MSHSSWNWELISDQPLELWLPDLNERKKLYPKRMVIASIMAGAGSDGEMENWCKLASACVDVGCDAIELNMSCPHMDRKDMGAYEEFVKRLISLFTGLGTCRFALRP